MTCNINTPFEELVDPDDHGLVRGFGLQIVDEDLFEEAMDNLHYKILVDVARSLGLEEATDSHSVYDIVICKLLESKAFCFPETTSSADPINSKLRHAVFERDRYRCRVCGGWKNLQIDHILPIAKGGPTNYFNLQVLCRLCNIRKKDEVQL